MKRAGKRGCGSTSDWSDDAVSVKLGTNHSFPNGKVNQSNRGHCFLDVKTTQTKAKINKNWSTMFFILGKLETALPQSTQCGRVFYLV